MNWRRPPTVPKWLVLPDATAATFGFLYAFWAWNKMVSGVVPHDQCGGPPPGAVRFAYASGLVEGAIGLALAFGTPRVRRGAALVGTGVNVGLIGFAAVASARGVETKGCGCFGGMDLPWSAHAAIAAGLALVLLAILLDLERRRAASP